MIQYETWSRFVIFDNFLLGPPRYWKWAFQGAGWWWCGYLQLEFAAGDLHVATAPVRTVLLLCLVTETFKIPSKQGTNLCVKKADSLVNALVRAASDAEKTLAGMRGW